MKLITLNIWGGKIHKPFIEFIKIHQDIDIFCFQEIFHDATEKTRGDFDGAHLDLFNEIQPLLPNHKGYFCPTVDDYYGIATFIRKDISGGVSGNITIYDNPEYDGRGGNHSRKALWYEICLGEKRLSILNVHGLWNGKGKSDTEDRLNQSRKIKELVFNFKDNKIILCGDFNLMPDTESLAILESGMINLVKEHGVTSTRSSFYKKPLKFADYILVSPNVEVKDFKVLQDEVSDHLPLYVEFL